MQALEPVAQRARGSDRERVQLVQARSTRLISAAPLDEQCTQGFTGAAAAEDAQPRAGEQPPSGEQGIERVVLALTAIAAARPLALEHRQPASGEEACEACSVARRALDRKTAAAKRLRPGKQLPVAMLARKHRALVELSSESVERNRQMRTPVRVDADGNRPFHAVASLWLENGLTATGLCQATAQASLRSAASPAESGGRQIPAKASLPAKP